MPKKRKYRPWTVREIALTALTPFDTNKLLVRLGELSVSPVSELSPFLRMVMAALAANSILTLLEKCHFEANLSRP